MRSITTFRRAQPADAASLRALTRRAMAYWPRDAAYLAEANRLLSRSLTTRDLARDEAWIAERDGAPVGFYRLSIDGDSAEIEELMVEPAWIGRGVGRALFEHAVTTARRAGVHWLEWDTDGNAAGFYRAMGGREIGTRPSGIPGDDPLIVMRFEIRS